MKKHIALILTAVLMLNLCPIGLADAFDFVTDVSAAEKDKPVLIYVADDFEKQVIGDPGNGFWPYGVGGKDLTHGAEIARDDNPENRAVEFISREGSAVGENYIPLFYAPLAYDFVLDFSFNIGTATDIVIGMRYDEKSATQGKYGEEGTRIDEIIRLSSNVTVSGKQVASGLDTKKWHRFQMQMNKKTNTVDIYVDGELVAEDSSFTSFKNICSLRFFSPTRIGGEATKYYIDDMKIYLSDRLLTDEEFEADLAEYDKSGLRPNPRYIGGFESNYYQFVFDMFYDEFVMSAGGRRVWKDNQFYDLPINILLEDGKIIVPIRAFSEMMGATVDYIDGVIIVTMNGRTMKLIVDSETYYVDDRASKLYTPVKLVKGHSVIDIDVLCAFFGIDYERFTKMTAIGAESYDMISFSGELVSDYEVLGTPGSISNIGNGRTMWHECLIRMNEMLKIDLPSPEEILEIYYERFPNGKHPSYLIPDFEKYKAGLEKGDELYNRSVQNYISQADTLLSGNGGMTPTNVNAESAYRNLLKLAFAWNMTGDQKYLDYICSKIDDLYVYTTETWDKVKDAVNGLAAGNQAIGFGTAYDWMYNTLIEKDPERLDKLRHVVQVLGIDFHDYVYRSPYQNGWTGAEYSYGNQIIFRNTGIMACCVALMDEQPERCSELLSQSIRAIVNVFGDFAPTGGWAEGISYWQYTVDTMPLTITALEETFGTHFGLYDLPGVAHTSDYPLSVMGATGQAYPTGDGDSGSPWASIYTKEAKYNNDLAKALQYREHQPAITLNDITNWVFLTPEDLEGVEAVQVQNDVYMEKIENVMMKTGSGFSDTSILVHGGGVNDGHGHEDNGNIMFDMLGYRWASDLGREDYNVYQFGDYVGRDTKNPTKPYTGYAQYSYYRNNAEGHNTVFANLGGAETGQYHMKYTAKSNFVKKGFSDTLSFALLDMTETNPIYDSAVRGVKLDKIQNEIVIHDRFQSSRPTDFHWGMHTEADIEVAEDGRSAILSVEDGAKRIWMGIISDDDYIIKNMAPVPYDGVPKAAELFPGEVMKPAEYKNKLLVPPLESPVDAPFATKGFASKITKGFRRLTIETVKDTDDFNLMVAFKPLLPGQTEPTIMPDATAMENWSVKNAAKPGNVDEILVNGEPLAGLRDGAYNYTYTTLTNEDPIPNIEVKANEKYTVDILPAETIPGITTVTLKEGEQTTAIYYITINPLNDFRKFMSDKQIPLFDYEIAAGYDTATDPANLFDNDYETRFATDVQGGWVLLDLGEEREVASVMISFNNGANRKENLKVEYSTDKENWILAYEGTASGTTKELQPFNLPKVDKARYIKVSFYGNSSSSWASATEIWAFSK